MYACMRDDGWGDWMMDDENWISMTNNKGMGSLQRKAPQMGFFFQSPQLCESDPTFWIVNGVVVGDRAAATVCAQSLEIAP